MNIKPKNGQLLVKELPKLKTKSGLILVSEEDSDSAISHCEVLESDSKEYKKGDQVLFSKMVPDEFMTENEDGKRERVWFIHSSDVRGVIEQ